MLKLTNFAKKAVKKNKKCRSRLCYEMDKGERTIYKWIELDALDITSAQALKIISEETGIPQEELLEL